MNADLEARLKRLMVFRVVMVTTLLFIATYVEVVSETLLTVNPLYFVIGATYALTVVHVVALRFVPSRQLLAHAQLVGDLVMVTALVYVTGGVRTGFLLLYPLSVLSATMLVPRRAPARGGDQGSTGPAGRLRGTLRPPGPRGPPTCRRALVCGVRAGVACAAVAPSARTLPRACSTRGPSCARQRSKWPTCAGSTR
jgi:hypothetical protein